MQHESPAHLDDRSPLSAQSDETLFEQTWDLIVQDAVALTKNFTLNHDPRLRTIFKRRFLSALAAANKEKEGEDTKRLDWIIEKNVSIDCPEPPDSKTWVVYGLGQEFGSGLACHKDLREAIDLARAGDVRATRLHDRGCAPKENKDKNLGDETRKPQ